MGLRSTYLHNFQLQQKQYCGDWMLLSLRYEDHLYAKLFHHLVSLHCYDQVICHVWWKNGFEIRIILITIRGFGISKITNPKSVAMEMVGGRVYLFWFGGKSEEMKQKREREPKPLIKPGPQFLLSTNYMPKRTTYNEFCWISLIPKIDEILKIHIDISY